MNFTGECHTNKHFDLAVEHINGHLKADTTHVAGTYAICAQFCKARQENGSPQLILNLIFARKLHIQDPAKEGQNFEHGSNHGGKAGALLL